MECGQGIEGDMASIFGGPLHPIYGLEGARLVDANQALEVASEKS